MTKIETANGEMYLSEKYEIVNASKNIHQNQTPTVTRYFIGAKLKTDTSNCCSIMSIEVTEKQFNKIIKDIK